MPFTHVVELHCLVGGTATVVDFFATARRPVCRDVPGVIAFFVPTGLCSQKNVGWCQKTRDSMLMKYKIQWGSRNNQQH